MGIFPKGFKLPQGMSISQAQKTMQATSECAQLVDMLLKDEKLGFDVGVFIQEHKSVFPVLSEALI